MPDVQLRGINGETFRISTRDRDRLRGWFMEWLPYLYPASMPEEYGDPVVMMYPLEITPGKRDFDWLCDTRYIWEWIKIPRDPMLALDALETWRAKAEEHLAKRGNLPA